MTGGPGLVVVCLVTRAVGPAVLGGRELPAPVRRMVTVLAPALLAGLVVTEIGGECWAGIDAAMVAGVLVAGGVRLVRCRRWSPSLSGPRSRPASARSQGESRVA